MRTNGYQPKQVSIPVSQRSEVPARAEAAASQKVGHSDASAFAGAPAPAPAPATPPAAPKVAPTVGRSFGAAFKDMFLKPKNAIGMGLAGAVAAVAAFPVLGPAAIAVGGIAIVGLGLLGAIGSFIQDRSDFKNPKPPEA